MPENDNKKFFIQHLFLWVLFTLIIISSSLALVAYFSAAELEFSRSHQQIYWFAGIFSGTVGTLVAATAAILFAKNLSQINKSNQILAQSERTAREATSLHRDLFELEILTRKVPKLASTLNELWSAPYPYTGEGIPVKVYDPITEATDENALKNQHLITDAWLSSIFKGLKRSNTMDNEVSSRLNQVIKIAFDYFKYLKLGGAPEDVQKLHRVLMSILEPVQESREMIVDKYPTCSIKASLLKLVDLYDIIQNQMTDVNQSILDQIESAKRAL